MAVAGNHNRGRLTGVGAQPNSGGVLFLDSRMLASLLGKGGGGAVVWREPHVDWSHADGLYTCVAQVAISVHQLAVESGPSCLKCATAVGKLTNREHPGTGSGCQLPSCPDMSLGPGSRAGRMGQEAKHSCPLRGRGVARGIGLCAKAVIQSCSNCEF